MTLFQNDFRNDNFYDLLSKTTLRQSGKDCGHGDRALIMIYRVEVTCIHLNLARLQQFNPITLVMHFTLNSKRLPGKHTVIVI